MNKEQLIVSRKSAYTFLFRYSSLNASSSVVSSLMGWLGDNALDLANLGVDVDSLRYGVDPYKSIGSSFAGLFWFSNDYSSVNEVVGVKEFHASDVAANLDVFPDGFHNDYASNTSSRPRGRVSVIHGNVVINVGLRCPDKAVDEVIRVMGLSNYRSAGNLHVNKGYHWDSK